MSKKVLVLYYSQSGQLGEIIQNLTAPLSEAGHTVEEVCIRPATPYPFPWTGESFFSVMPDCVLHVPTQLERFSLKEAKYDLVVLGYQAWFLSPSIPFNSILQQPEVQAILPGTPVITITGARNMWISAMEDIKKILKANSARLAGNIVLVDKHHNVISFITIFHWMFRGKKERYLNVFPKPGVADSDIAHVKTYGHIVEKYLQTANWEGLQAELVRQHAVEVKYNLMFIESKAKRIFGIWAKLISKRKKRTAWLVAFKYYLLIALFIAAPIILTVDAILFKPFLAGRIKRQKQYYLDVK